jgi:oligopeptide transport system ATP-binding protein
MDTQKPLLKVSDLTTTFATADGDVSAVNDVSFELYPGESVGIVGESGSGKSQIFMSIMGLLAANGRASGSVSFIGEKILNIPVKRLNKIRGGSMSMIFQDPMTSLNPYMSIERQLAEVLIAHQGMNKQQARTRALEVLELVRIPEAKRRLSAFPHELSGGMRQRVMIAMSLLCSPKLLIADEPTTALDVTVQAQVLDLMKDLRKAFGTAIALITHDLGVVAGVCDRLLVVYAGRIIETGTVDEIFANPQHPYTQGLLKSMPRLDEERSEKLATIAGQPPNLNAIPEGCAFSPRCPYVMDICKTQRPELLTCAEGRSKACHLETL